MNKISSKQIAILEAIHEAILENGYPPTVREIAAAVGLASTSTVHGHLSRLEKGGYIVKNASLTRALELTEIGRQALGVSQELNVIPLLGKVTAGLPILAVEEATDYYPIPPQLQHFDTADLFMLEIKGESMINIGIMDGDLITVRRQATANNGEVVIALTEDNEATCKTFYKSADHFILRPENDLMDDIILDQITILGKVVSLFREF